MFFIYISAVVEISKTALSIVIPCYNPVGNWKEHLLNQIEITKQHIPSLEVVIVNDGSTTFNAEECATFFAPYPQIKFHPYTTNQGKGYALREGVKHTQGELIIYTDIDFPYTHHSFLNILQALQQGSDVAIGIRGNEYYTHLPKERIYISKFLRFLIRTMLRIPTDDTQCGLKGFNQQGKRVFMQTSIKRYLFDLEFVFLSARNKLKIKTVQVELRPGIQLSTMRMGVLVQEAGNFVSVLWRSLF